MIELFDAARLEPRRDWSLPTFALALALGAGALAAWGYALQGQWRQLQAQRATLAAQLRPEPAATVSPALLADLERQATLLEAGLGATRAGGNADAAALRPSDWLQRLAALGSAGVSLSRIDIDRQGQLRIEGQASGAAAVSGFVQAFARQDAAAGWRPRSIELREDKASSPYLRFALRASPPGAAATPGTLPAAAAPVEAAASAAPTRVAAHRPEAPR